MAAITVSNLQAHNNRGVTLQKLAANFNMEVDELLVTMRGFAFFVWNNCRAHVTERREIHYKINLPQYLGHVLRMFDDGDTFDQTMNQIAKHDIAEILPT